MASFKALCLAGVASLAVTAAANAADLLPPPPPPVEAPAYAPPVAFGGNWYLRGDVGVGIADLSKPSSSFKPGYVVADARYDSDLLNDSGFIDAGVGYRFNEYFRADVTGEYRAAAHYSAIESYSTAPFCSSPRCLPRGYDQYTGQVQSTVGLVNGYVDLGTWWGFTPFFGAGVGFARVGVNNVTDFGVVSSAAPGRFQGAPGGFGYSGENYKYNFTYALMAGLDFAVTQNLKMEFGYRYLDMGTIQSGVINCVACGNSPQEVQRHRLAYNDFRLGFRYTFADYSPVPVAAPSFPLVRKY